MISEHVAFDAAPLGSILARECAAFSDLLIRGGPPPLMAHALVIRVDTEGVTQRVRGQPSLFQALPFLSVDPLIYGSHF